MAQSPDDVIVMKHPKLGSLRATATRRALDESWKMEGWVLDDKTDPADVVTAPSADATTTGA